MDNDLISRSALLEALENDRMIFKSTITVPEALLAQGEHWRRCLDAAPAVDAVVVTRCKDCDHLTFFGQGLPVCLRHGLREIVNLDDFCSHGERGADAKE